MSILKDLPELVKADVISEENAGRIQDYYLKKGGHSTNRLFIVFGILGAILVGLGIILIIAHNWDELSKTTKTFFAFLPLVTGQVFCGFTLFRKTNSIVWRESSAAFLFCAVGACVSLVSQIYNIPDNLSSFVFTWMIMCLPLVYVIRSSVASLLYIIGITHYACNTSYWSYPYAESYDYWLLLIGILPHYYYLYKNKPESNFMVFHNWLVPLSAIITLGTVAGKAAELMNIAYFSLFGLLYLSGSMNFFMQKSPLSNGFKRLGSLGTIFLLLFLSFDWFWEDLRNRDFRFAEINSTPEFLASVLLSIAAGIVFLVHLKNKSPKTILPTGSIFMLFILTFLIGMVSNISVVLINLYVLLIGISIINDGARQDHLGILNYGLLIITALVICRFFDTDLSFVIRGILFVSVGIGFFAANYLMLKKRKTNE